MDRHQALINKIQIVLVIFKKLMNINLRITIKIMMILKMVITKIIVIDNKTINKLIMVIKIMQMLYLNFWSKAKTKFYDS